MGYVKTTSIGIFWRHILYIRIDIEVHKIVHTRIPINSNAYR